MQLKSFATILVCAYVNLTTVGVPHTGGRHANMWFASQTSVVERYIVAHANWCLHWKKAVRNESIWERTRHPCWTPRHEPTASLCRCHLQRSANEEITGSNLEPSLNQKQSIHHHLIDLMLQEESRKRSTTRHTSQRERSNNASLMNSTKPLKETQHPLPCQERRSWTNRCICLMKPHTARNSSNFCELLKNPIQVGELNQTGGYHGTKKTTSKRQQKLCTFFHRFEISALQRTLITGKRAFWQLDCWCRNDVQWFGWKQALALDFDEQELPVESPSTLHQHRVHAVDETDYLINLIDTPGHVDFGGDVTRTCAVDGCFILACAVEDQCRKQKPLSAKLLKKR